MARSRNIKPGFCRNEDLAECSVWARLCFALLPMIADREGRLEDRPKRIKGELFPFDSIEVEPLLLELDKHGLIARYTVESLGLIQILGFRKHQNPHHREPESTLPCHQSLRLDADGKYIKPEAFGGLHEPKAQETIILDEPKAQDEPRERPDISRLSRADSGTLIPDSGSTLAAQAPGASALGEVGKALKRAGLDPLSFNLGDPRAATLIAQGATPAEFEGLAREALAKGVSRPWGWVLAVLPDRRAQAATIALAPPPAATALTAPSNAAATTTALIAQQNTHRAEVERQRLARKAAKQAAA